MGVKGEFVASDVAGHLLHRRTFSEASPFEDLDAASPTDWAVSSEHDGWSDVRGMAVRFHLFRTGLASDLIATTLGEFFVRNVDDFFCVLEGRKTPTPIDRRHWLLKIYDFLQLKVPPRNPNPNETESLDAGAL